MMNYCAAEDLNERLSNAELIQLTDDAHVGVVNQDIVASAISAAQDIIDGYLRGRYAVPLTSVPGLIKNIAADIAAYKLFKRRNQLQENNSLEKLWTNAKDQLEKLQAGTMTLPTDDGAPLGPKPLTKVNKTAADRVFSKERLEGF